MNKSHKENAPTVFIIDDDSSVLEAMKDLFQSVGLLVEMFESTRSFDVGAVTNRPGCLVLDVRLPGQSGLEFQSELLRKGAMIPIVFISGHADVSISVRAMKAGAIDFLTKPVQSQELLDAVHAAIKQDEVQRAISDNLVILLEAYRSLTTREREILKMVVVGLQNKQIAGELGISEATVKLHRGHVMQKMNVRSIAELVRKGETLKIAGAC